MIDSVGTGNQWLDVIIAIAAIITALGVIWRKVFRPIVRGIERLADATPVLFEIAKEFHGNGGETLKDAINRIEERLAAGGDQIAGLLNNQGRIAAEQIELGAKLDALHEYSHNNHHENVARIEGLAHFDEAITRKVDALAEKLEHVPGQLNEIQEGLS